VSSESTHHFIGSQFLHLQDQAVQEEWLGRKVRYITTVWVTGRGNGKPMEDHCTGIEVVSRVYDVI